MVRTGTHLLSILNYLSQHSRTSDKIEFLNKVKSAPFVEQMFVYAVDPFMKYNIRKTEAFVRTGTEDLGIKGFQLLSKLSRRAYTGQTARDEVMAYMKNLDRDSAIVFARILKKDLDCGVSTKLINRVWSGVITEFDCQLVEEFDPSRTTYPVYVGPKLDGIRGEYRNGIMYTRKGHVIKGAQHITSVLKLVAKNVKLSGELWVPGWPFNDISGYVRQKVSSKPKLQYAVFSIVTDEPMSFKQRLGLLQQMFPPLGSKNPLPISYVPHFEVRNYESLENYYRSFLDKRFEGVVIKHPDRYHYNGRNYDWMRMVPGNSAEFLIVGVEESDERLGELGAIIIRVGDNTCKVGSGFTSYQRKRYWDIPDDIIGRWATINFKERTADGLLRQPIFKEIRWDI